MSRKVGNERQFVEGVEEEEIDRSEGAGRAGGDKEQAGVEEVFPLFDSAE